MKKREIDNIQPDDHINFLEAIDGAEIKEVKKRSKDGKK